MAAKSYIQENGLPPLSESENFLQELQASSSAAPASEFQRQYLNSSANLLESGSQAYQLPYQMSIFDDKLGEARVCRDYSTVTA